jgi:hypothetical protein
MEKNNEQQNDPDGDAAWLLGLLIQAEVFGVTQNKEAVVNLFRVSAEKGNP